MAVKMLSKSLLSHCTHRQTTLKPPPLIPLYLLHRHRSSKPQPKEINLSSPSFQSDGDNGSEEEEGFFIKKLEEILHRVILQKSTPDWLPFRPGSSFWVPPMVNVKDLVNKFAGNKLSDDETLALTTCHGWPSASYFTEAAINVEEELPEEVEGKVIVEVLTSPTDIDVELKEEKGHLNVKVDRKEGDEAGREVVVQGDEVEGKVEVLILAGSSLKNEEG